MQTADLNRFYLRLSNGLGNQLFQTAFGLWAVRGDAARLAFDPSWYVSPPAGATPRKMLAPAVLSSLNIASVGPDRLAGQKMLQINLNKVKYDTYLAGLPEVADHVSVHSTGLVCHYSYVAASIDAMRGAFHGSQISLRADDVAFFKENSVIGVHVRRGDFLRADVRSWLGIVDPKDQLRELSRVKQTVAFGRPVKVVIFSNESFTHDADRAYFSKRAGGAYDDIETLKLMGMCDWLVTANSTFSLFAAYLSRTMQGASVPKAYLQKRHDYSQALLGPGMVLYENSLL